MRLGLWKQGYPETHSLGSWGLGLLAAPQSLLCLAREGSMRQPEENKLESKVLKAQTPLQDRTCVDLHVKPLRQSWEFILKGDL